jgi:hypothetical protein
MWKHIKEWNFDSICDQDFTINDFLTENIYKFSNGDFIEKEIEHYW